MTAGVVVVVIVLWLVVGFVVGAVAAGRLMIDAIKRNRELWTRRAAGTMADLIRANDARATAERRRAAGTMADLIRANDARATAEREREEYRRALLASAWLAAWRIAPYADVGDPSDRADRRDARIASHHARAAERARLASEPEPEPPLTCGDPSCPGCRPR